MTVTIDAEWLGPAWPTAWLNLHGHKAVLRLSTVSADPAKPAPCAEIALTLEAGVVWPPEFAVEPQGVRATFLKQKPEMWTSCHREPVRAGLVPARWSLRLKNKHAIAQETFLLKFSVQSEEAGGKQVIWLPPGQHINIHIETITEGSVFRSYTPVPSCLVPDSCPACPACPQAKRLCLIVKRYSQGALTPTLCSLAVGDKVTVSGPEGRFRPELLNGLVGLTMLAAGTGVTPMLGAVVHFLQRSEGRQVRAHLVYFNRTKADIIWRKHFADLAKKDPRFSVDYVLSEPGPDWTGRSGRIDESLLASLDLQTKDSLVLACGPIGFTHSTKEMLLAQGIPESGIYCFLG